MTNLERILALESQVATLKHSNAVLVKMLDDAEERELVLRNDNERLLKENRKLRKKVK